MIKFLIIISVLLAFYYVWVFLGLYFKDFKTKKEFWKALIPFAVIVLAIKDAYDELLEE